MIDLQYPIGKFSPPHEMSSDQRSSAVENIERTPFELKKAVKGLSELQIETPYREGGWTIKQVVHHLADSHLNAFSRFKLTLTEDVPLIYTYKQDRWAELNDSMETPITVSLNLLESLHQRWVILLKAMSDEEWDRKLEHPEIGIIPLFVMLSLYSHHGPHHIAHITNLRNRMGW